MSNKVNLSIPLKPSTGGRPAYQLTPEIAAIIESMASHGCSMQIIANCLGIDHTVFVDNDDFSTAYKKSFTKLQDRLACAQVYKAIDKGDTIMQIWLGKQHLGQRDTQEIQTKVSITVSAYALQALQALAQLEAPGEPAIEGEVRVLPAPEIIQGNDKIT